MSVSDSWRTGFEGQALKLAWPEPDIALATMTRGREMNTLTLELIEELDHALDGAENSRARALIITGSGRAFCCGAHLNYFTDGEDRIGRGRFALRDHYLAKITRVLDRVEAVPLPVIAAINGYALGGGCELSLACDFRVLAAETRIGVPETRIGALAGAGGVQKLHRLVGRGKAMEWILLGEHIEPADALAHGLVTAVVPGERVLDVALDLARRFRTLGPLAVAQSKMAVHLCGDANVADARRIGLETLAMLIDGPEWDEGMRAFMERRLPRFPDRP